MYRLPLAFACTLALAIPAWSAGAAGAAHASARNLGAPSVSPAAGMSAAIALTLASTPVTPVRQLAASPCENGYCSFALGLPASTADAGVVAVCPNVTVEAWRALAAAP